MFALIHCKVTGDGKTLRTAFRPKVAFHVPYKTEEADFWNWIHPDDAVNRQYCLVKAPAHLMAQIEADQDISVLSPVVESMRDLEEWLDTEHPDGTVRHWLKKVQRAHHVAGAAKVRAKGDHLRAGLLEQLPADGIGPLRF